MKRKGKGKRCLAGQRVAGRADAGSRARKLLDRWIVEAWEQGDSEETLAALVDLSFAVVAGRLVRSQRLRHGAALVSWWGSKPVPGEDGAAPQQLRQDW